MNTFIKVKIRSVTFLFIFLTLNSCTSDQYQGKHASQKMQRTIEKKTESYHAKEANKVIEENIKNKDVNEAYKEKRRKEQEEYLAKLNKSEVKIKKFKKRTVFNFY